jgi:hypothetical protein
MAPAASVDTNDLNSTNGQNGDEKTMPYQGAQPYGMPNDLVIPGIMDLDKTDERLWVNAI